MASSALQDGVPDALALRRAIYGKGDASKADLTDLIARGPAFGADPDFRDLVAEVAKDVFIHQVDPEGYVTEADAAWLMEKLGDGGGLSCRAEYEILKSVFSHALSVPPALTEFAVREVEKAILTGRRDSIGGVDHEPGIVTDEDVAALRALVFAATQGSSMHVGRGVAEALFDIAHATATSANSSDWPRFFAQAVGNYVMGAPFLGAPDRAEVLQAEAVLNQPTSLGSFLSSMFRAPSTSEFLSAERSVDEAEEIALRGQNAANQREIDAAAGIDAAEAKWILAHLTRGGSLTEAERCLISFIREEAPSAPAEIKALYDRAA